MEKKYSTIDQLAEAFQKANAVVRTDGELLYSIGSKAFS